MEENKEGHTELQLVTSLKGPCLFTCQIQYSQNEKVLCG